MAEEIKPTGGNTSDQKPSNDTNNGTNGVRQVKFNKHAGTVNRKGRKVGSNPSKKADFVDAAGSGSSYRDQMNTNSVAATPFTIEDTRTKELITQASRYGRNYGLELLSTLPNLVNFDNIKADDVQLDNWRRDLIYFMEPASTELNFAIQQLRTNLGALSRNNMLEQVSINTQRAYIHNCIVLSIWYSQWVVFREMFKENATDQLTGSEFLMKYFGISEYRVAEAMYMSYKMHEEQIEHAFKLIENPRVPSFGLAQLIVDALTVVVKRESTGAVWFTVPCGNNIGQTFRTVRERLYPNPTDIFVEGGAYNTESYYSGYYHHITGARLTDGNNDVDAVPVRPDRYRELGFFLGVRFGNSSLISGVGHENRVVDYAHRNDAEPIYYDGVSDDGVQRIEETWYQYILDLLQWMRHVENEFNTMEAVCGISIISENLIDYKMCTIKLSDVNADIATVLRNRSYYADRMGITAVTDDAVTYVLPAERNTRGVNAPGYQQVYLSNPRGTRHFIVGEASLQTAAYIQAMELSNQNAMRDYRLPYIYAGFEYTVWFRTPGNINTDFTQLNHGGSFIPIFLDKGYMTIGTERVTDNANGYVNSPSFYLRTVTNLNQYIPVTIPLSTEHHQRIHDTITGVFTDTHLGHALEERVQNEHMYNHLDMFRDTVQSLIIGCAQQDACAPDFKAKYYTASGRSALSSLPDGIRGTLVIINDTGATDTLVTEQMLTQFENDRDITENEDAMTVLTNVPDFSLETINTRICPVCGSYTFNDECDVCGTDLSAVDFEDVKYEDIDLSTVEAYMTSHNGQSDIQANQYWRNDAVLDNESSMTALSEKASELYDAMTPGNQIFVTKWWYYLVPQVVKLTDDDSNLTGEYIVQVRPVIFGEVEELGASPTTEFSTEISSAGSQGVPSLNQVFITISQRMSDELLWTLFTLLRGSDLVDEFIADLAQNYNVNPNDYELDYIQLSVEITEGDRGEGDRATKYYLKPYVNYQVTNKTYDDIQVINHARGNHYEFNDLTYADQSRRELFGSMMNFTPLIKIGNMVRSSREAARELVYAEPKVLRNGRYSSRSDRRETRTRQFRPDGLCLEC